ncbi:hypothetical protein [uncultured Endozoicomonas sp.]|uniref:plasmid mobilization protein n=1 Tax=uncultured Endozoicomonas sp. TaxID=432652 RepID=UPI002612A212|nr:hypothetical protein [uncultured Endozoicomonas sp.]
MESIKQTQIQIRVSLEKKAEIKATAEALNSSMSEFILAKVDHTELPPPVSEFEREQLKLISEIGNRLNLLVKKVNNNSRPDDVYLQIVIEAVDEFIRYVINRDQ